MTATCSPLGAGKWRDEYAEYFRGAESVTVVADDDVPGYRHARTVARSLRTVVADDDVRVCAPHAGKDVAEHLAFGHALDDLEALSDNELMVLCSDMADMAASVAVILHAEINEAEDEMFAAPDGYRLSDSGNSDRFVDLAEGEVRWVREWGHWIVWRKGSWRLDLKDSLVTQMAKRVGRRLLILSEDHDEESLFRAGMRAESAPSLANMIKLARGIPGVMVEHEDLDANPYILNCTNGTVDLRTGELLPHNPADLCTQQCPVDYDPTATSELWERCLECWQPDPVMRDYLQREMGAAATGKATETLSVHYGLGGNGKSKFFGAVQRVLGPYSVEPHKSLLMVSKHEQHATVIADLFRVRLGVFSETEEKASLNDAQVKNLTGGDRMRCRRMKEDPWSFDPTHTLVMFSNYKPEIHGTDEGIWRRVRLIPWEVKIPKEEIDGDLADKLAAELPAILTWMVEGARRFLADKQLWAPDKVMVATDEYRNKEDTVGRFVAEMIELDPTARTESSVLNMAHTEWARDSGINEHAIAGHWRKVAGQLRNQGAESGKGAGGARHWDGISLRSGGT
jgi:putative DNA primase/helicase